MKDTKKEAGLLILVILLALVLISPFISFDSSITGATVINTVGISARGIITSIPPNFLVLALLTVGLIVGVSEIQTRKKR